MMNDMRRMLTDCDKIVVWQLELESLEEEIDKRSLEERNQLTQIATTTFNSNKKTLYLSQPINQKLRIVNTSEESQETTLLSKKKENLDYLIRQARRN